MGWFFCRRALGILKFKNKPRFDLHKDHKSFIYQPCFLNSSRMMRASNSSFNISSFENMIELHRARAQKSVIIEINSEDSLPLLCNILNEYGTVLKAYHYQINSVKEAVLIEFETREAVDKLLKICKHDENVILPVQSRLLKFSPNKVNSNKKEAKQQNTNVLIADKRKASKLIAKDFLECKSVSDQLNLLYEQERIDDLHLRLRFMVCSQLESGVSGIFPSCRVFPFGSSINGFGSNLSDLDMILDFRDFEKQFSAQNSAHEMYFQMRNHSLSSRLTTQRVIDIMGDFLYMFFPSMSQINRIPRARVPIIKFHHDLTNVDCDLSFSNLSGFYMSELIYIYGHYDKRLNPLVFAVRKWAKANRITHETPGPWITNFTLSLLVIFFLQTRVPPILPSVQSLKELADVGDERITGDVNCSFLRDITKIPAVENTECLGTLLSNFFKFYEKFNFSKRAISIVSGKDFSKPNADPLHIENPLEVDLNISKNVNLKELERFCEAARLASVLLSDNAPATDSNWGIISLFGKYFIGENGTKIRAKTFQVIELFDREGQTSAVGTAPPIAPPKQKKITETKNIISYGSKNIVSQVLKQKRNRKTKIKVDDLFKRW